MCINPLSCPKVSVWWKMGETCVLSTEDRRDTWALFGLTSLSQYFALGKETLSLVVGESGKSFGETVGGLRGSEFWTMPYCMFIPQWGPGPLGGNQEFLQCFERMETPSVLAVRDILACNLGLWHHDPILPYLLNLMLGQGFALSLGPADCCWVLQQSCFAAQGGAASGKWPCLEKPARKGGLWNTMGGQVGWRQLGSTPRAVPSILLLAGAAEPCRQAWSWPVQWGKGIPPRSWD